VTEKVPRRVVVRPLPPDKIYLEVTALPTPSNRKLHVYVEARFRNHEFNDTVTRKVRIEELVDWQGKESTRRTILDEKVGLEFKAETSHTNALTRQPVLLKCRDLKLPEIQATTDGDGKCALDLSPWRRELHPRDRLRLVVTASTNGLTGTEMANMETDALFTPLEIRQWDAATALKDCTRGYENALAQAEEAGAQLFCPTDLEACKQEWKTVSESAASGNPPDARDIRHKSLTIEARLSRTICTKARERRRATMGRSKELKEKISALITKLEATNAGSLIPKPLVDAQRAFSKISVMVGVKRELDHATLVDVVKQYESILKSLKELQSADSAQ